MQPIDPVVGGTTLRIPDIHSPNFVHLVSGWTINIDGSAEFNNLFFRGTLMGTDFEVNANGAFFYDGTPALGNLIASIAPQAGADEFGNLYMQGIAAYSPSGFATPVNHAQLQDGTLSIGPGVDFINSFAAAVNGANDFSVFLNSPVSTTGPQTSPLSLLLQGGTPASGVGAAATMRALLTDFNGAGPADFGLSGAVIKTTNAGVYETWHNPAYVAGWTGATTFQTLGGDTLQYRLMENDTLWLLGLAQTAAGGSGTTIMNLPAGWRPKAGFTPHGPVSHSSAGVVTPAEIAVTSAGAVIINSTTRAAGDAYSFNTFIALHNVT